MTLRQSQKKFLKATSTFIILIIFDLPLFLNCNKDIKDLSISIQKDVVKIQVFNLFNPYNVSIKFEDESIDLLVDNNDLEFTKCKKSFSVVRNDNECYLEYDNIRYPFKRIKVFTNNKNPFYGRYSLSIPNKIIRHYQGGLEIYFDGNKINLIVIQKIEDLVFSILSSESNDDEGEYLKAFAIIIRTYITKNFDRHKSQGFDFCDNTHCQVFLGEDKKNLNFKKAVKETEGSVITYNNQPVDIYYCGSCGGKTLLPQNVWKNYNVFYPYKEINCNFCSNSKYYDWSSSIKKSLLNHIFFGNQNYSEFKIGIIYDHESFPEKVSVQNQSHELYFTTDDFRIVVGRNLGWNKIFSNKFNVRNSSEDKILFEGKGFGHCVGFCQSGGEEMSRKGKLFKEIIDYYFPDCELRKIK